MKNLIRTISFFVCILFLTEALAADRVVVIPLNTTEKPVNVVTVSQNAGDFKDPLAAINSIISASAANPYVVFIYPGIYHLEDTLVMKPFVTVTGSGLDITVLTGAISTYTSDQNSAIVSGADNATLRNLSINNTGGGDYSIALHNRNSSPIIENVAVTASGGAVNNFGILNQFSSPSMSNLTATASEGVTNYGIYNYSSSPSMANVTLTASGGSHLNYGVLNTVSSRPTMNAVTATASGEGISHYGVYNNTSSEPVMTDVTATATGGNSNYGVWNKSSTVHMNQVVAVASGGKYNYGMYNYMSTTSITGMSVTADEGPNNYGVYSYSSSLNILQSVLDSTTGNVGIAVDGGSTTVMNSSIIGDANILSGNLTCFNCDDGQSGNLDTSCQPL